MGTNPNIICSESTPNDSTHVSGTSLRISALVTPYHSTASEDALVFMVLKYTDINGQATEAILQWSLLHEPAKFIKIMADRGYRWSNTPREEIEHLRAQDISVRGSITFVPGWHGQAYLFGNEVIAPEVAQGLVIKHASSPVVKIGSFAVSGTLLDWQRNIGKFALTSSLLRVAVAMPLAGVILRIAGLPGSGLALVGPSSIGKSTALYICASVAGHLTDDGLPDLGASAAALEQLMVGHRDGVLVIDEGGFLSTSPQIRQAALRSLAFRGSAKRGRGLAGQYDAAISRVQADMRLVYLISLEESLAGSLGQARLQGEEVRLIEIDAAVSRLGDIFDGPDRIVNKIVGDKRETRGKAVEKIPELCRRYQGIVMRTFVQKLVNDKNAKSKIAVAMSEFRRSSAPYEKSSQDGRIANNFAVYFAAASLAIEYKVLNWSTKTTRSNILRVCRRVLKSRRQTNTKSKSNAVSQSDLLKIFIQKYSEMRILRVKKGKKDDTEKVARYSIFDVRDVKRRMIAIDAQSFKQWFDVPGHRNQILRTVRAKQILLPGSSTDTATRQIVVDSSGQRRRCYLFDAKKLQKLIDDAART